MIVLNLQCEAGHGFEGWFASSEAFDDQVKAKQVICPMCGHERVNRLPSGPRVLRSTGSEENQGIRDTASAPASPAAPDPAQLLRAFADILSGAEDVSTRFAEEARKIHYGDAEHRNIKGKATLQETAELLEEGIPVLPIPIPDKDSMH